ncbi:MAG: hypothetical protein Q9220_007148 [cf. Caloplaca sp. 1 TL-2023]
MRSCDALQFRLLTHNVRYATDYPFTGEVKWKTRAPRMISELRFNVARCEASFICLQEVLHQQLADILHGLNQQQKVEWRYIGVGRDDGMKGGEYSPILYQPSIWTLQRWETVWLSETPEQPSLGWDAACIRILTIGVFQHRQSKQSLIAMNTHLDHQGALSRYRAAEIILKRIDERSDSGNLPVFLAGDFNSQQSDDAYKLLASHSSPMKDLHTLSSPESRYGHQNTFTGFGDEKPTRIDFLFVNQSVRPWLIQNYGVLENRFDDDVYISDHRAVVADVVINEGQTRMV